ncbi:MAG TPA: glycosyltransferase [Acidimicrobiia bacterium]|nr:glycosyltransferase [Acidimicrobiia bacterium]
MTPATDATVPAPARVPGMCSIIVPAYNVERWVAAALDSALTQTYRPLEVVVVDDGSTDGTAAVLARYADHPDVVLVSQENRGLAGARNAGLAVARGEYVGLLDADDLWDPERTTRCIERLARDPDVGWVTSDLRVLEGEVRTDETQYRDRRRQPFVDDDQLRVIVRDNFVCHSAVIRRDLFDRFGPFDVALRRAEDYDLWIRFLLGGSRVALVDEPLGWYRIRPDSLSADLDAQWSAHLAVLEKHLDALTARGIGVPVAVARDIAQVRARRGDRRGAARAALQAARAPDVRLVARTRLLLGAARARAGLSV